ncbi:MAG: STAS domain-containing protein [Acidobacteriota bacterium]
MEIRLMNQGNTLVVGVRGRLDSVTAAEFDRAMSEGVSNHERRVILDFSELDYMSSAGMRSLLVLQKRLEKQGGGLVVAGVKGLVNEVFVVSGFDSVLPVFESLEAALASPR